MWVDDCQPMAVANGHDVGVAPSPCGWWPCARPRNSLQVKSEAVSESYPQVLSTQFTFFFKFVFPVLLLGVLGLAMIVVTRANPQVAVVCLIPIGLIVALFWFYAWPIKRVVAYEDHLVVSNYLREVNIPFDHIASVEEVRWINWRPVVVTLKTASPFGSAFIFYPAVDSLLGGFSEERSATRFLRQRLARS
jgi:hypothetical protein